MQKVVVAFDVDGTLIKNQQPIEERRHGIPHAPDTPILHQIKMLRVLSTYKNIKIVVWSGGGKEYAATWGRWLCLDKYVWRYAAKHELKTIRERCDALIAIDDMHACDLGDVNLIVREK